MISPSVKRSISVVPAEEEVCTLFHQIESSNHPSNSTIFLLFILQTGRVEYKRQVHNSSAARMRSLATQMSYRLDEGNGCCMYRIGTFAAMHCNSVLFQEYPSHSPTGYLSHQGVEDDGCHSLLDYEAVAESARVLGEYCTSRSPWF